MCFRLEFLVVTNKISASNLSSCACQGQAAFTTFICPTTMTFHHLCDRTSQNYYFCFHLWSSFFYEVYRMSMWTLQKRLGQRQREKYNRMGRCVLRTYWTRELKRKNKKINKRTKNLKQSNHSQTYKRRLCSYFLTNQVIKEMVVAIYYHFPFDFHQFPRMK